MRIIPKLMGFTLRIIYRTVKTFLKTWKVGFAVFLYLYSINEYLNSATVHESYLEVIEKGVGEPPYSIGRRILTTAAEIIKLIVFSWKKICPKLGLVFLDLSFCVGIIAEALMPVLIPYISWAAKIFLEQSTKNKIYISLGFVLLVFVYKILKVGFFSRLICRLKRSYSCAASWATAGTPFSLALFMYVCLWLMLGKSRLSSGIEFLWNPIPLVGSILFFLLHTSSESGEESLADFYRENAKGKKLNPADMDRINFVLEITRNEIRIVSFWLQLWMLRSLADLLTALSECTALNRVFGGVLLIPKHLVCYWILIAVVTGGTGSVVVFVRTTRALTKVAYIFDLICKRFVGVSFMPLLQLENKRKQHPALKTAQHNSSYRKKKLLRYGLSDDEIYALNDTDDVVNVLEFLVPYRPHSIDIIQKVAQAASSAVGLQNSSTPNSSAQPRTTTSSLVMARLQSNMLTRIAVATGVELTPKVIRYLLASIWYLPQLLILILPSFLSQILLLLPAYVVPFYGSLSCLVRGGCVKDRVYWLLYYTLVTILNEIHNLFKMDPDLQMLPFAQTRLLLGIICIQVMATLISATVCLRVVSKNVAYQAMQICSNDDNESTNFDGIQFKPESVQACLSQSNFISVYNGEEEPDEPVNLWESSCEKDATFFSDMKGEGIRRRSSGKQPTEKYSDGNNEN